MSAGRETPAKTAGSRLTRHLHTVYFAILEWNRAQPRHVQLVGAIMAALAFVILSLAVAIGASPIVPDARVNIALGFNIGLPLALAVGCYLITQCILVMLGKGKRSRRVILADLANDMILLALFVTIAYLHFNLKMWIPLINPALYDAEFMAVDEYLRGIVDAFTWISTTLHSTVSDGVRWYQFGFILMFVIAFCRFSATRNEYYPRFVVSISLIMSLGALSYLIAPALGPFIYEDGIDLLATEAQANMHDGYREVRAAGFPWIESAGSEYFTAALAAMPSLHIANASVMTYYMLRSGDYLAPFFVFLWFWILFDSVALRWHYIVDAPAGILLAALVIWLTGRLLRGASPERASSAEAPDPAAPDYYASRA